MQLVGDDLDTNTLYGCHRLLLMSGFEPTAAVLGFTLLSLARDPELRAQLPDDPAQIPAFVDGVLRHR